MPTQKIVTFLTFNDQAEAAIHFYASVFENSKIISVNKLPAGNMISGTIEIEGQLFYLLNGGPYFSFAQGISLFINCESQQEVDTLWEKLSADGEIQSCGWLKDKFGVSWQIIPTVLGIFLQDKNRVKAGNVMKAMLQMKKIEIDQLQQAYDKE
jgi:predicted 3-demethylubiquinone-9 3-methyltransferase (glyoxalase superfamily)